MLKRSTSPKVLVWKKYKRVSRHVEMCYYVMTKSGAEATITRSPSFHY